MPCVVDRRRADAQPAGDEGRPRVVGDRVLVERDAGPVEHQPAPSCRSARRRTCAGRRASGGCRCRPTRAGSPRSASAAASASALRTIWRGVVGEARVAAASRNATALAAMTCSSGPPCSPGKTALSMASAMLGGGQDAAATRAAQRLVRGERDDVGVRHRVRVRATGDEPGDVRGVEHEQRADLVGDRPERLGIDDARVGRGAGDDHLRAAARGRGRAPGRSRCARRTAVTP